MANTLKEFKNHMEWSTLELTDSQIEQIYRSVDAERYENMDDLGEDYNNENSVIFYDVDLHSVIENFSEIIERGLFRYIHLFYLSQEGVYVGVYAFDIWC
ncbi:hypothetical protein TIMEGRIFFIN_107 [Bacillus phage vB_BspH_TimeGriffin]|nr:hypothetical protein TIMEGRIFFIN_107 [Bacillus phage vB_BspH_TimeGriffin]